MNQTIDELMEILQNMGCSPERFADGVGSFERHISFMAADTPCWIEWNVNISYLSIGSRYSSYIPFVEMHADTTWPSCKRGLKFYLDKKNYVIVATKLLDWQERKMEVV